MLFKTIANPWVPPVTKCRGFKNILKFKEAINNIINKYKYFFIFFKFITYIKKEIDNLYFLFFTFIFKYSKMNSSISPSNTFETLLVSKLVR